MTTITKNIDLSQLTAFDRGSQMVLLTLTETGDVVQMWAAIQAQFVFLEKLAGTKDGWKTIKRVKIEKDTAGNLVGAVNTETSQLMQQADLVRGMLTTWSNVLDLSNAAKAAT